MQCNLMHAFLDWRPLAFVLEAQPNTGLNVNECVYADCYCCRMAPERWLLFDSDVGRYPLSVSCGQLMHASLFIGLFIGNNDYIVSVMIVYENIIFLIFFFGILLKFICFFLGVCP